MSKKKRNVRRVAVLGNNNAGKTVFITSLIANFEHYDPEILKLGDGWRVISAKMTNDEAVNGLNRFPKEFYYRTLVDNGKWPKKTYSASVACLDIKLKREKNKWYRRDIVGRKLEIVDIAGERVADFGMINRNFRQWSAMTTIQLAGEGIDWNERFKMSGIVAEQDYACEKKVLDLYRDVLVELYKAGANASMTPSTSRITLEGESLDCKQPDDYRQNLKQNPVGLSGKEFTPLPEFAFNDDKYLVLVQKFEEAYEDYKKKIVDPVWDWLKGADDVLYLVDVLGILADGVACYNAEQALASSCFSQAVCNAWRTEESILKKGTAWLKAKRAGSHFRRLVVIATKSDVSSKDCRGNMKNLARQLLEKEVVNSCFDKSEYMDCAAICAEQLREDQYGQVPEKWDDSWNSGKYKFEFEKPPSTKRSSAQEYRRDIAPKNYQLGAIAKLILDID